MIKFIHYKIFWMEKYQEDQAKQQQKSELKGEAVNFLRQISNQIIDCFEMCEHSNYSELIKQCAEIEIKHALLKKSINLAQAWKFLQLSNEKIILVNKLDDHRLFKINAGIPKFAFQESKENLQNTEEMKSQFIQVAYSLQLFCAENQRYQYQSQRKFWQKKHKIQLFQRKYDIISEEKYFRIDLSLNQYEAIKNKNNGKEVTEFNCEEQILTKLQEESKQKQILRFDKIEKYRISKWYSIKLATIYQIRYLPKLQEEKVEILKNYHSNTLNQYIKKLIEQMENLSKQTKQKVKYQMELNFQGKNLFSFIKSKRKDQFYQYFLEVFKNFRNLYEKENLNEEEWMFKNEKIESKKYKIYELLNNLQVEW